MSVCVSLHVFVCVFVCLAVLVSFLSLVVMAIYRCEWSVRVIYDGKDMRTQVAQDVLSLRLDAAAATDTHPSRTTPPTSSGDTAGADADVWL